MEKINTKTVGILIFSVLFFVLSINQTYAHVVVQPSEIGVGKRTNFVVGVPTEGDVATTRVRLIVPEGVKSVRPLVKTGWTVELVRSGEGENSQVTQITWSGGNIPAEQKDEFVFSAQVPDSESVLQWKAYQVLADGSEVAWDTDPEEVKAHEAGDSHSDEEEPKPFSTTNVVNDLSEQTSDENSSQVAGSDSNSNLPLTLSVVALVLAGI